MGLLSSEIDTKQMVPICRQLATAYDAGIPITRALEIVRENVADRTAKRVLENMSLDVRQGNTLGDAAQAQSKHLPRYFVELLRAGEFGGRLDAMLRDLADYFEDRLAIRREVVSAMTYPIFMIIACWFLGTFALRLILSLDFNSTARFDLAAYIAGYIAFQAQSMAIALGVLFVVLLLIRVGVWRWIWGWITNFIWPLYPVTRRFALARFFRSMSLLIGAGVPIKACIVNSAAVTVNAYIERDLLKAVPHVQEGATLVEAFGESKFLTNTAREMLFVGEQSGSLDVSLRKVAEYHLAEAQQAVRVALQVFRQIIVLAIALLVGYIVIRFWSVYFGAIDSALGGI